MTDEPKKPYVKPQVTQVALRPGEAVLGGCKTATVMGPAAMMCTNLTCMVIAS
ncbi:MAG: hypothetical protein ACREIL_03175 [Nitrospiraceae bacterium]